MPSKQVAQQQLPQFVLLASGALYSVQVTRHEETLEVVEGHSVAAFTITGEPLILGTHGLETVAQLLSRHPSSGRVAWEIVHSSSAPHGYVSAGPRAQPATTGAGVRESTS